MNMRKFIPALIFVLMLFSCILKPFEVIEETWAGGNPKIVKYYKDEKKEVLVKEIRYYENGSKKIEGNYQDDQRSGQWSFWYPDGSLWSQGVYKNGKENGLKTVWHKNGQKYYEGVSTDDKRTGIWRFWNEEGELIKEIDYNKEPGN